MPRLYKPFYFKVMVLLYRIHDLFRDPAKKLASFGIGPGFTVVDYGCGPGRYLPAASSLVGPKGRVYAADIHPLSAAYVGRLVARTGAKNVVQATIRAGRSDIPDGAADLIYALDMFHLVSDPVPFLAELRRIIKPGGRLIIEDGHQSRTATRTKLAASPLWTIDAETAHDVRLRPKTDVP